MNNSSRVKLCLANLKSIEATLNEMAIKSTDEEARHAFHEACLKTRKVVQEIEVRVHELQLENPLY